MTLIFLALIVFFFLAIVLTAWVAFREHCDRLERECFERNLAATLEEDRAQSLIDMSGYAQFHVQK
jgi:hypothetical protein